MAQGYGNFAFMHDIDRDFYKDLIKMERNARIDVSSVGNPLRKALERFVALVISTYNLESYFSGYTLLAEKIERLGEAQTLQYAKLMNRDKTFPQNELLPFYSQTVSYAAFNRNGEERTFTDPIYTFLRKFGNAFSHEGDQTSEPKKNYKNLLRSLSLLHKILVAFYGLQNIPKFDEYKMPIGEYIVDSYSEPEDKNSKCATEFRAHSIDRDGNPEFYALLRLYRRSNLDANFMLRNRECFVVAAKESEAGVPEGMTRMRELTPRDSTNEFYIIAYIFNQEPQPLSNGLLAQMELPQRLELCKRLARSLATLHNAENPIYHRLLSYDSIYVCRRKDSWRPYIVKFDYAKIDMQSRSSIVTVRAQATAATQAQMELAIQARYIPREWPEKEDEDPDVDWGKVDVYSLGVLMLDILHGEFTVYAPGALFNALRRLRLPMQLQALLAAMCEEIPGKRCTMQEVWKQLEKISL